MVTIIAAVSQNGVIGKSGTIPWTLKSDLLRFKRITQGNTVIMGRNTWNSLPVKPLPDRQNVVVTRCRDIEIPGAEIVRSVAEAFTVSNRNEQFIIGGSGLYREGLGFADKLILTRVLAQIEGDTFFPEFDLNDWKIVESALFGTTPEDEYPTILETYLRV